MDWNNIFTVLPLKVNGLTGGGIIVISMRPNSHYLIYWGKSVTLFFFTGKTLIYPWLQKKKKNEINIHGLFGLLLSLNIVKLLPFSSN
jgi:hypothetical protein